LNLKLGNEYSKQGLYDRAIKEYRKIDKLNPLYKQAEFNIRLIEKTKHYSIGLPQDTIDTKATIPISNIDSDIDKSKIFDFFKSKLSDICPLLTIVIPCFNASNFIENTLKNIILAKSIPLEIIVVDDGSTDNTLEILQKFSKKYSNIKVLSQTNSGAGIARNKAIKQCKGLYTFFLDADDEIDIAELSKAIFYAMTHGLDLVFLPYQILYVEKSKIDSMYPNDCEIFKTSHSKTSQALLQNSAMNLTGFPWNRLILTELLNRHQIKFGDTVVHNDILFHWHSICSSERLGFWYEVVCTHKKFQSGTLSSLKDHNRLSVFDAILQIYEKLKNNVIFQQNIDMYNDISEKIIQWDRKILLPEIIEEFDLRHKSYLDKKSMESNIKYIQHNNVQNKNKLVSVVTVTRNILGEDNISRNQNLKYFQKMLNSVMQQSYGRDNIEHIVIDGASTDGTKELLDSYFKRGIIDKFISEPDSGIYNAMNKGVKHAIGQYIIFLNAQDYLAHNAIVSLISHMRKTESSYCFGNSITVDNNDFPIGKHDGDMNRVFFGMPYCHQALICNADIFKQVAFPENLKITTWGFALALYLSGLKYSYVPDTIAFFRSGGLSTSEKTRQTYYGELKHLRMYIASKILNISYELYVDMRSMSQDLQSIPFRKIQSAIEKISALKKTNKISVDFLAKFICLFYMKHID
jgi:glycosyltransferase involved in cell wall biosynthesis